VTEERSQNNKLALQIYEDRSVGCPPNPDLSAMTKEERKARRATVDRLNELVEKAEKGNREVVPELRKILKANPELAWQVMNYSELAQWHFIQRMTRDEDFAKKEVLERQLAAMREEILGEYPSPLERLLAERVIITWLQIQLFEGIYGSSVFKMKTAQDNYFQKKLDQTHRRHLSAIRTLAQICKLGTAVQINIAEKQVNTAG
jgi:hypothetical protein